MSDNREQKPLYWDKGSKFCVRYLDPVRAELFVNDVLVRGACTWYVEQQPNQLARVTITFLASEVISTTEEP